MRILFIGATGSVGTKVIPELARQVDDLILTAYATGEVAGLPVQALDICDFDATMELITATKADCVVNCAIAGYEKYKLETSAEDRHHYTEDGVEVNLRGAYHIYEAAARAAVSRVVFISSMTTVMGQPRYSSIQGVEAPRPSNTYACTKLFGEQVGEVYSKTRNLPVTCLRLGQPYSPGGKRTQFWLSRPESRALFVQGEDIALAVAAASRQTLPFAVYPVVSQSDAQWVEPSAYAELGFKPRYYFTQEGSQLIEAVQETV